MLAAFVRTRQALDDFRRRYAGAQELESPLSVMGIDQRLRGQRADAARGVRAERADGEEPRRDGDAEGAARGIARYD